MDIFDPQILEQMMQAAISNPGLFQSYWEMDENDIEEESEEEIQSNPRKKILWAAENDKLDIVMTLLKEEKRLISSTDSDGYTPLHRACYNGHTDMVKLLLSNSANIEAKTEDGWHPIHSAARWNQADVVAVLLQNGADINAKTNSGQTPLHLAAAEKDSKEVLSLLLQNCHIDVNLRNSVGDTAEDICSRTSEWCKLFQEKRMQMTEQTQKETSENPVGDSLCSKDTDNSNISTVVREDVETLAKKDAVCNKAELSNTAEK